MPTSKEIDQLKSLIEEDAFDEVIEILKELDLGPHSQSFSSLKGSYNEFTKTKIAGTWSEEEKTRQGNDIRQRFLTFMSTIHIDTQNNKFGSLQISLALSEEDIRTYLKNVLGDGYCIGDKIHESDRSIIFKVTYNSKVTTPGSFRKIKVLKPFSILDHENFSDLHYDGQNVDSLGKIQGMTTIHSIHTQTYPWFFVMEYIKGRTIKDHIDASMVWRIDEVIKILVNLMETVENIHDKRICHGYLRPHKIILDKEHGNSPIISPFRSGSYFAKRTFDRIYENCLYMSPEELSTGIATKKSDQFSIGLIAYELLEGKPLFGVPLSEGNAKDSDKGSTIEVIKIRIKHQEFLKKNKRKKPEERISYLSTLDIRKDCPKGLVTILDRLLQYDPADRYESIEEAKDELKDISTKKYQLKASLRKVNKSYERCRRNPKFMVDFYDNLTEKLDPNKAIFKDTNLESQYDKLDMVINRLINISALKHKDIDKAMFHLAEKHAVKWGIMRGSYSLFTQKLLNSIKKFDEEDWDEELEMEWSKVLEHGTKLMEKHARV